MTSFIDIIPDILYFTLAHCWQIKT